MRDEVGLKSGPQLLVHYRDWPEPSSTGSGRLLEKMLLKKRDRGFDLAQRLSRLRCFRSLLIWVFGFKNNVFNRAGSELFAGAIA